MEDKKMIAFTIRDAARVASVGETTLRGWVRRGLLPICEIGGKRLIKRTDLEEFIDAHRSP